MFGLVKAFEDAKPVELLFETKEQAEAFVRFVHLYIQEGAVGNGYSAYWHYVDNPVIGTDKKVGQATLRIDLIQAMAKEICRKRKALSSDELHRKGYDFYYPSIGVVKGCIRFEFDEAKLPPRLKPNVGDLAMIVDLPEYDRVMVRIKEIREDRAVLTNGKYCSKIPDRTEVPLVNVMKIHDFINKR